MSIAFSEGYDAYWEEYRQSDNPYPEGSDNHFEWNRGWLEAEEGELNPYWL